MNQRHEGTWSRFELDGKPCDVLQPPGDARFGLIFLHGVGLETLRDNPVWTPLLQQHGLVTICPHGKRSWWSNRICAEFDAHLTAEQYILRHVVPLLRERWRLERPRIAICGISMGGQGALRLAMKYPGQFPVVAGISSAIEHQILHGDGSPLDEMYIDPESVRQDNVTLHVHPLNWPRHLMFVIDPTDVEWLEGNQRLHEKLAALGIPHEYDFETAAGGHSWAYFDRMAAPVLEFLVRGLEAEERRIPMCK